MLNLRNFGSSVGAKTCDNYRCPRAKINRSYVRADKALNATEFGRFSVL